MIQSSENLVMEGRMDRWMVKQTDVQTDGHTDGQTDG